ncbi:MAG: hypothetical protein U9O82_14245 [Thermodesulfobacteriota bacterium]|nr:hypothetical protein [Thermodesulfobacteriota bacterium]
MECERLKNLIKSWYLAVQDESLAPARMVSFMQNHITNCDVCLIDLEVQHEVDKITEIVLPQSKRTVIKSSKKEKTEAYPPTEETLHEATVDEQEAATDQKTEDNESEENNDSSDDNSGDNSGDESGDESGDDDYDEEITLETDDGF